LLFLNLNGAVVCVGVCHAGISYIFDGVMLFLTKHVGDVELQAKARDDSPVRVFLNLTKKLDHPTLHVANLMFHKVRTELHSHSTSLRLLLPFFTS
jgi:hypothetical protein